MLRLVLVLIAITWGIEFTRADDDLSPPEARLLYLKRAGDAGWEVVVTMPPLAREAFGRAFPIFEKIRIGDQIIRPQPTSGDLILDVRAGERGMRKYGLLEREPKPGDKIVLSGHTVLSPGIGKDELEKAKAAKLDEALREPEPSGFTLIDLRTAKGRRAGLIVLARVRMPADLPWNTANFPGIDPERPNQSANLAARAKDLTAWEKKHSYLLLDGKGYASRIRAVQFVDQGSETIVRDGKKLYVDRSWPMREYRVLFLIPGDVSLSGKVLSVFDEAKTDGATADDFRTLTPALSETMTRDVIGETIKGVYVNLGDVTPVPEGVRAKLYSNGFVDSIVVSAGIIRKVRWGEFESTSVTVSDKGLNDILVVFKNAPDRDKPQPISLKFDAIDDWIIFAR